MEKQANSLLRSINKIALKYLYALLLLLFIGISQTSYGQVNEKYIINDIIVTGNTSFNANTIITYSRLKKGEEVSFGGDKIGEAIKKLWKSNLFSSIDIYFTNITDDKKVDIEMLDLDADEAEINQTVKEQVQKILDDEKEEEEEEETKETKIKGIDY